MMQPDIEGQLQPEEPKPQDFLIWLTQQLVALREIEQSMRAITSEQPSDHVTSTLIGIAEVVSQAAYHVDGLRHSILASVEWSKK